MTCAEFKDRVALYALDLLDPDERRECEAHLRQQRHEGCLEALAHYAGTVASLVDELPPISPPPHVWRAIDARIGRARPARRSAAAVAGWALFAAAAAVAIFLWWDRRGMQAEIAEVRSAEQELRGRVDTAGKSLVAVSQQKAECVERLQTMEKDLAIRDQAMQLLETPGTQLFSLAAQIKDATASASALVHPGLRRGFVVGAGMRAPPGKVYQLWVIRGTHAPQPAGTFPADDKGRAILPINLALFEGVAIKADTLAVTLEPEGGSLTPTPPVILVGSPKGG